jgi:hypothetical protein
LNENKAGLILQTTITIVITTDPSNASKVIWPVATKAGCKDANTTTRYKID